MTCEQRYGQQRFPRSTPQKPTKKCKKNSRKSRRRRRRRHNNRQQCQSSCEKSTGRKAMLILSSKCFAALALPAPMRADRLLRMSLRSAQRWRISSSLSTSLRDECTTRATLPFAWCCYLLPSLYLRFVHHSWLATSSLHSCSISGYFLKMSSTVV